MRRGLLAWDASELPLSTLEARLTRLRAAMKEQKLDAFAAYTNISRPAAVSWLSGFTPYWSEGLLYVPAEGEIAFATALSKRVAEWITTVMPRGEVIPTPTPGIAIGKRLAAAGLKRVGMPDLDDIPARQGKDLATGAPGIELVDASDLFNAIRRDVDDAERALVRKAADIADAAMALAGAQAATAQELVAPVEGHARKAAAEDVFLSLIPDLSASARFQRTDTAGALGASFALRAALAYKAGWVRLTRSFARDAALSAKFAAAETAFETLTIGPDRDPAKAIAAALAPAGANLRTWSIEQPRGSYPLVTVAAAGMGSSDFRAGSPFTLNVECDLQGQRWMAARAFGL